MDSTDSAVTETLIRIKARSGWSLVDFKELCNYRDLFWILVWRDVKVRYAQTVLGAMWAIIQPVFSMIIFTIVFGRFARIPSDGIPYPIFNFSAVILWQYFASSVSGASNSLVGNQHLITKVYFPRLVIPTSRVLAGLVDFCIAFIVLQCLMIYFGFYPTWTMLGVPLLVLVIMASAAGVGMTLSAINVKYRDVQHTVPFVLQAWMYASPIVYPVSIVPEKFRLLYGLNPMVGVVEGCRSLLLHSRPLPGDLLLESAVVSAIMLIGGMLYFKRTERYFADVI